MKRFQSIFCLVDEAGTADTAVRRARRLALTNGAELTFATVVPPEDEFALGAMAWGDGLYPEFSRLRQASVATCRSRVEELAAGSEEMGISARAVVLEGRTFLEAIREVERAGHDLVMKGAEEGGGIRSWLFGTHDHHLMRSCPVPVWILDREVNQAMRVVLAAVDVSGTATDPLNIMILELASSLAAREGAELAVVHAWSSYPERYLRAHAPERPDPGIDRMLRTERLLRSERLEALVRAVSPEVAVDLHLRKGEASRMISLVARETAADLLVMGTLGRSGIPGLLIGNTAESVLGRVRCGVLTVKPEGFQTPVRPAGATTKDKADDVPARR